MSFIICDHENLSHSPSYWKKENAQLSEGIVFVTGGRVMMMETWRKAISIYICYHSRTRKLSWLIYLSLLIFSLHLNYPNWLFLPQKSFKSIFSFSPLITFPYFHCMPFLTPVYYKTHLFGYSIVSLHYTSSFTLLSIFSF